MSSELEALSKAISGRTEAMLELLSSLVRQNSHTANKAGGDVVGRAIESEARALGLCSQRVPSEKYADHWLLSTPRAQSSSEGSVVLVGHIDTVFPEGTFEGFRRDGDIAHGPGVLDMKGGIVVMLEALRAIAQLGGIEELNARLILVGDEEVGSPEGRSVIENAARGACCALVFEAGRAGDKIITRRKGTGSAKVVAVGKAAHAANGHREGINAIWGMARFVDLAQRITDYDRGVTVNVGVVQGGEAKNTVPDRCECQLDFRFERVAEGAATFGALRQACEAAAHDVPGSRLEISGGPGRMPLERSEANVAIFEAYAEHARAAGLGFAEAGLIAGGSDASSTAGIGVPSIDGLGPRGTGFHTKEEMIEVSSLEPKALALARFLWTRARADRPGGGP